MHLSFTASLIEKLKKKQGRLERQADSDDEDTTDLKKVDTSLYTHVVHVC